MKFLAALPLLLTTANAIARQCNLNDCGALPKCYLVNLSSNGERNVFDAQGIEISQWSYSPTVFDTEDSARGWSIMCHTVGRVDYVKYFMENDVKTHYSPPFFLNGDNSGTYINKFDALSEKCGGPMEIKVKHYTWTSGDECPCGETTLYLKTKCDPVVTHPPRAKYCSLRGNVLNYGTMVTPGMKIEVHFGAHNAQWLTFTAGSSTSINVNKHQFNGHPSGFFLRFYNEQGGVAGHWTWCRNYNWGGNVVVSLTHIPAKCYLWANRLNYDAYVPVGTTIEVITGDHKTYTFKTTHTNVKYLLDPSARGKLDRRNFQLRILYSTGYKTPFVKCRNFTPIGIDVDKSGSVEHMTGKFQIDITGDGEVNELEEWFAATEGILIDSADIVDGVVTGEHLFGDMGGTYADGFEKLTQHDADGDGEVSGDELEGLAIWVDGDSNNILDEGELSTLESHGIVSLSTLHTDLVGAATLEDGSVMRMEDLFFKR